jgi:catalase
MGVYHGCRPGFPQAQTAHDNFWDFVSLMPESTHMLMWIMSDRAIPRSFRFMEGFGVHTFRLVNAAGESTFVKFHWKPKLGMQSVAWNEAVKINGADPDFHRRDLWDAIQQGDFPEWELGLQLFDEEFADRFAKAGTSARGPRLRRRRLRSLQVHRLRNRRGAAARGHRHRRTPR